LSAFDGLSNDSLPAGFGQRMGQMASLAVRLVLAYIDRDEMAVETLVEQVGTWDDSPASLELQAPVPAEMRYRFALKHAMMVFHTAIEGIESALNISLPNEGFTQGAIDLIQQIGPAAHRETALECLRQIPAGIEPIELNETGPGGLCAVAASVAALYIHPEYAPTPEALRLTLLRQARDLESDALGVPRQERADAASENEALDFLTQLFNGDDIMARSIPRNPRERTPAELDMIAALQAHLLETPADATTPEQAKALKQKLITILEAGISRFEAARASAPVPPQPSGPPPRGPKLGQRAQPKRTTRSKRKK
jgi:hypothetical protein